MATFHPPAFSTIILPYGVVKEYHNKHFFKNQWLMITIWLNWGLHEYLMFLYIWHPKYRYYIGNGYSLVLYLKYLWGAMNMCLFCPNQLLQFVPNLICNEGYRRMLGKQYLSCSNTNSTGKRLAPRKYTWGHTPS